MDFANTGPLTRSCITGFKTAVSAADSGSIRRESEANREHLPWAPRSSLAFCSSHWGTVTVYCTCTYTPACHGGWLPDSKAHLFFRETSVSHPAPMEQVRPKIQVARVPKQHWPKWFSVPHMTAITRAPGMNIRKLTFVFNFHSPFLPLHPSQCQDRESQPLPGPPTYRQWYLLSSFRPQNIPSSTTAPPPFSAEQLSLSLFFTFICYLVRLIHSKLWKTNKSGALKIQRIVTPPKDMSKF